MTRRRCGAEKVPRCLHYVHKNLCRQWERFVFPPRPFRLALIFQSCRRFGGRADPQQQFPDRREAAAVMDGYAVSLQPGIVIGRAIALVAAPVVAGMLVM